MKPVIIIPTYACGKPRRTDTGVIDTYDHMTPITNQGELVRCLTSMRCMEEKAPVVILVVAEKGVEEEALRKIRFEAAHYPELNITVVGAPEEEAMHARMAQMGIGDYAHGLSLTGYSAVKNLGLAYAAVMGYTEAIFIDDDEVIEDPQFLEKATYGLGMLTQKEVPILIKSGYFIDRKGSYHAPDKTEWYNRFWRQHQGFNAWIDQAMSGSRLSSSNLACGGCLALHREAFRRVSFDPWISRGEDLDFLLNVRMFGSEVWFDNKWVIKHQPPATSKVESRRFIQDIYRWLYEIHKLEFSATQIDLLQIQPESLYPYPGPFLESSMNFNIRMTALLRSIGRAGQRKGYFRAATRARKDALVYAEEHCNKYFAFQRQWPEVMSLLENDIALRGIFENAIVRPLSKEELAAATPPEFERPRARRSERERLDVEQRPARERSEAEQRVEHSEVPVRSDEARPAREGRPVRVVHDGVPQDFIDAPAQAFEAEAGFESAPVAAMDAPVEGAAPFVEPRPERAPVPEEGVRRRHSERAKSPFEDVLKAYEGRTGADRGTSGVDD